MKYEQIVTQVLSGNHLSGEELKQLKNLVFLLEQRLRGVSEVRAYVLDADKVADYTKLSTKDIQEIAERTGRVYSLNGFQEAFNYGDISSENEFIFFVEVEHD